jgi:hypothetical protein
VEYDEYDPHNYWNVIFNFEELCNYSSDIINKISQGNLEDLPYYCQHLKNYLEDSFLSAQVDAVGINSDMLRSSISSLVEKIDLRQSYCIFQNYRP